MNIKKSADVKSYVINLSTRPDRKMNSLKRISGIGQNPQIIAAISGDDVELLNYEGTAPRNVIALWQSHRKVWQHFLTTNDDACFVFEDDVQFSNGSSKVIASISRLDFNTFDVLQIGFLPLNSRWNYVLSEFLIYFRIKVSRIVVKNLVKLFSFPILNNTRILKATSLRSKLTSKKLRIEELVELEQKIDGNVILLSEFRSGTHAYLVTKRAAQKLLDYNVPTILGADLAFQMLAISMSLRVLRLSSSVAGQDDTPVSVGQHHLAPNDLGSLLLRGERNENRS
jgi:GR25 family glycosyltransferase involved in LPS biosynthesis